METGTFKKIDLKSPDIEEMLNTGGALFRRKIEPIRGVREPDTEEQVNTIVNGIIESSNTAMPGEHKIITGSRGEEFVFTNTKFSDLYVVGDDGSVVPRERWVRAMLNPFGVPIRIDAPWGTPEDPQTADGTADAMLVFGLDADGRLTDDRYIIGDLHMFLANYEPA